MGTTIETKPVTPGDLIEVTRELRKLGVAGFSFRGCEVTFYEPLPIEMQTAAKDADDDDDDDEEDETPADRVKRIRKQMLDADIHGSA
jgi:hypothetical protein